MPKQKAKKTAPATVTDVQETVTLSYRVKDISTRKYRMNSPPHNLNDLPWCIEVDFGRMPIGVPRKLALFGVCNKNVINRPWCCKAKVTLRVVAQNKSVANVELGYTQTFFGGSSFGYIASWGFPNFMDWDKFTNPANGYVVNDTALFEMDVTVEKPRFDRHIIEQVALNHMEEERKKKKEKVAEKKVKTPSTGKKEAKSAQSDSATSESESDASSSDEDYGSGTFDLGSPAEALAFFEKALVDPDNFTNAYKFSTFCLLSEMAFGIGQPVNLISARTKSILRSRLGSGLCLRRAVGDCGRKYDLPATCDLLAEAKREKRPDAYPANHDLENLWSEILNLAFRLAETRNYLRVFLQGSDGPMSGLALTQLVRTHSDDRVFEKVALSMLWDLIRFCKVFPGFDFRKTLVEKTGHRESSEYYDRIDDLAAIDFTTKPTAAPWRYQHYGNRGIALAPKYQKPFCFCAEVDCGGTCHVNTWAKLDGLAAAVKDRELTAYLDCRRCDLCCILGLDKRPDDLFPGELGSRENKFRYAAVTKSKGQNLPSVLENHILSLERWRVLRGMGHAKHTVLAPVPALTNYPPDEVEPLPQLPPGMGRKRKAKKVTQATQTIPGSEVESKTCDHETTRMDGSTATTESAEQIPTESESEITDLDVPLTALVEENLDDGGEQAKTEPEDHVTEKGSTLASEVDDPADPETTKTGLITSDVHKKGENSSTKDDEGSLPKPEHSPKSFNEIVDAAMANIYAKVTVGDAAPGEDPTMKPGATFNEYHVAAAAYQTKLVLETGSPKPVPTDASKDTSTSGAKGAKAGDAAQADINITADVPGTKPSAASETSSQAFAAGAVNKTASASKHAKAGDAGQAMGTKPSTKAIKPGVVDTQEPECALSTTDSGENTQPVSSPTPAVDPTALPEPEPNYPEASNVDLPLVPISGSDLGQVPTTDGTTAVSNDFVEVAAPTSATSQPPDPAECRQEHDSGSSYATAADSFASESGDDGAMSERKRKLVVAEDPFGDGGIATTGNDALEAPNTGCPVSDSMFESELTSVPAEDGKEAWQSQSDALEAVSTEKSCDPATNDGSGDQKASVAALPPIPEPGLAAAPVAAGGSPDGATETLPPADMKEYVDFFVSFRDNPVGFIAPFQFASFCLVSEWLGCPEPVTLVSERTKRLLRTEIASRVKRERKPTRILAKIVNEGAKVNRPSTTSSGAVEGVFTELQGLCLELGAIRWLGRILCELDSPEIASQLDAPEMSSQDVTVSDLKLGGAVLLAIQIHRCDSAGFAQNLIISLIWDLMVFKKNNPVFNFTDEVNSRLGPALTRSERCSQLEHIDLVAEPQYPWSYQFYGNRCIALSKRYRKPISKVDAERIEKEAEKVIDRDVLAFVDCRRCDICCLLGLDEWSADLLEGEVGYHLKDGVFEILRECYFSQLRSMDRPFVDLLQDSDFFDGVRAAVSDTPSSEQILSYLSTSCPPPKFEFDDCDFPDLPDLTITFGSSPERENLSAKRKRTKSKKAEKRKLKAVRKRPKPTLSSAAEALPRPAPVLGLEPTEAALDRTTEPDSVELATQMEFVEMTATAGSEEPSHALGGDISEVKPVVEATSDHKPVLGGDEKAKPVSEVTYDEKQVSDVTYDEKAVSAADDNTKPVLEATSDDKPVSEVTYDEKQVSDVTYDEKAVSAADDNTKPVLEATSDDKPVSEVTYDEKQVSDVTYDEKAVSAADDNTKPVLEATSDDKPVSEVTYDEKPVSAADDDAKSVLEATSDHKPVSEVKCEEKPVSAADDDAKPVMDIESLAQHEPRLPAEESSRTGPKPGSVGQEPTKSDQPVPATAGAHTICSDPGLTQDGQESMSNADDAGISVGTLQRPAIPVKVPNTKQAAKKQRQEKKKARKMAKKSQFHKSEMELRATSAVAALKSGLPKDAAELFRKVIDMAEFRDCDQHFTAATRICFAEAVVRHESSTAAELTEAWQSICAAVDSLGEDFVFPGALYLKVRVSIRQFKYDQAREPLSVLQKILENRVQFEALRYPYTIRDIPATTRSFLETEIPGLLEKIRNPEHPDYMCRYENCPDPPIYMRHNFNGLRIVYCMNGCKPAFHVACADVALSNVGVLEPHNPREIRTSDVPCTTPDCGSIICKIDVYSKDSMVPKTIEKLNPKKPQDHAHAEPQAKNQPERPAKGTRGNDRPLKTTPKKVPGPDLKDSARDTVEGACRAQKQTLESGLTSNRSAAGSSAVAKPQDVSATACPSGAQEPDSTTNRNAEKPAIAEPAQPGIPEASDPDPDDPLSNTENLEPIKREKFLVSDYNPSQKMRNRRVRPGKQENTMVLGPTPYFDPDRHQEQPNTQGKKKSPWKVAANPLLTPIVERFLDAIHEKLRSTPGMRISYDDTDLMRKIQNVPELGDAFETAGSIETILKLQKGRFECAEFSFAIGQSGVSSFPAIGEAAVVPAKSDEVMATNHVEVPSRTPVASEWAELSLPPSNEIPGHRKRSSASHLIGSNLSTASAPSMNEVHEPEQDPVNPATPKFTVRRVNSGLIPRASPRQIATPRGAESVTSDVQLFDRGGADALRAPPGLAEPNVGTAPVEDPAEVRDPVSAQSICLTSPQRGIVNRVTSRNVGPQAGLGLAPSARFGTPYGSDVSYPSKVDDRCSTSSSTGAVPPIVQRSRDLAAKLGLKVNFSPTKSDQSGRHDVTTLRVDVIEFDRGLEQPMKGREAEEPIKSSHPVPVENRDSVISAGATEHQSQRATPELEYFPPPGQSSVPVHQASPDSDLYNPSPTTTELKDSIIFGLTRERYWGHLNNEMNGEALVRTLYEQCISERCIDPLAYPAEQLAQILMDYIWEQQPPSTCAVCVTPLGRRPSRVEDCGHHFHETCFIDWMNYFCPVCNADISLM